MTAVGETFPKSHRLRRRGEFLGVQRSSARLVTDHFIVYARATKHEQTRLGITVSRKVGRAHQRNRVKRLVREVFRRNQPKLPPGLDTVFVARPGKGLPTFAEVSSEMVSSLEKLKQRVSQKRSGRRRR